MKFREAKKNLNPDNAIQIGEINKPHGYKGQIKFSLYFDPQNLSEESVFVRIKGWLIPFFIDYEQSNFIATKPIIKFFEINTEQEAAELSQSPIVLPRSIAKKYVNLDSLQYMIGYQIQDLATGRLGEIVEFINLKKNPLLKTVFDDKEYLLPVNGTKIKKIIHKKKLVQVELAQGLLE